MPDFAAARARMIDRQIVGRGLADPGLVSAFDAVPRELFVSPDDQMAAYEDVPLPIEAGQTISQPYIVALMIDVAELHGGSRVLEIGAGSGYAASVMSRIADCVVAIERHTVLARSAAERIHGLGYDNIRILHGDGALGLPDAAPFDAILVAAAGREVPHPLLEQLTDGGVLVMPLGRPDEVQQLVRVVRRGTRFDKANLGPVRFVPLLKGAID